MVSRVVKAWRSEEPVNRHGDQGVFVRFDECQPEVGDE